MSRLKSKFTNLALMVSVAAGMGGWYPYKLPKNEPQYSMKLSKRTKPKKKKLKHKRRKKK